MPPKVTDTQPAQDAMHAVEAATAEAARHIVATYAEDFLDFATLSCMLGIEIEGLRYRRLAAEFAEPAPKKVTKKSTKKTTKKATKKTTAKATKKTTKKTAKKTAKKATKKTTKKATKATEE